MLTGLPPHLHPQEGGQSPEPLAIQPYSGGAQPRSATAGRGGRTAWRWLQAVGAERIVVPATYRGAPLVLQQGINPNQALLLNSLRRLLQVSPQMEQELKRWCAEPLGDSMLAADRQGAGAADHRRLHREAPDLGAQFAQLVKELRSEYFAAITLCAERLAAELAKSPATSVVQLLRRDGVFASTQQLSAAVSGPGGDGACRMSAAQACHAMHCTCLHVRMASQPDKRTDRTPPHPCHSWCASWRRWRSCCTGCRTCWTAACLWRCAAACGTSPPKTCWCAAGEASTTGLLGKNAAVPQGCVQHALWFARK